MRFNRYNDIAAFGTDVTSILLENEVQNNLLLSMIDRGENQYAARFAADWFLASVSGADGSAALIAVYAEPFPLLLYETGNADSGDAVEILAREMKKAGRRPPGAMAMGDLARRFTEAMIPGAGRLHMATAAMRLDKIEPCANAPGFCRTLDSGDISLVKYWEREFSVDCRSHVFTIPEYTERLKKRLGKNTHYIWEDSAPVSQAVHGRDTPNGAVVNGVYTPPRYRGRGYATSVVAALSAALLAGGKSFCCLFADADNPVSRGIYRKLGYRDVCVLEDIRFDIRP